MILAPSIFVRIYNNKFTNSKIDSEFMWQNKIVSQGSNDMCHHLVLHSCLIRLHTIFLININITLLMNIK